MSRDATPSRNWAMRRRCVALVDVGRKTVRSASTERWRASQPAQNATRTSQATIAAPALNFTRASTVHDAADKDKRSQQQATENRVHRESRVTFPTKFSVLPVADVLNPIQGTSRISITVRSPFVSSIVMRVIRD